MAAIPTSTSCSSSRRPNSTARSARRSCDKMQQIVYERTIYAPIWQLAFINGVGPRVGESGFGLIPGFAYTAPYEDITMKSAMHRCKPAHPNRRDTARGADLKSAQSPRTGVSERRGRVGSGHGRHRRSRSGGNS